MKECDVEGCVRKRYCRGYCTLHYQRLLKYGDPLGRGQPEKGELQRYFRDVVLNYEGEDCLIWPYRRSEDGYALLGMNGTVSLVSTLVCEHANGPRPEGGYEAAHNCGQGRAGCVSKRHMEWKTHAENAADKIRHGTLAWGEKSGRAKLTEAQVQRIRALRGRISLRLLAERYGVDKSTVGHILTGRSWKRLPWRPAL